MIKRFFTSFLIFSLIASLNVSFSSIASAAPITRATTDRPDDMPGYQIHLVYVALKDSVDQHWDTNGKIDSWITEANSWLLAKAGHKFIFDTYQGAADVTFMQSNYRASELCYKTCNALDKLEAEFKDRDSSYSHSKTLVFVLADNLDPNSCGWAYPGNLALVHNMTSLACTGDQTTYGLSYEAQSLIHELIHTFGINHQCFDNSDLMIGSPECPDPQVRVPVTLDSKRTHYLGGDASDGIDLLKMPIWSDNSGSNSYSEIRPTSGNKYLWTLASSNIVYAIVGQISKKFDWEWEKGFSPKGDAISCKFVSGEAIIVGSVNGSACSFDLPSTLRAGKSFNVSESWTLGPWHGASSVDGTLVRADYSSNICTQFTCFAGGSTNAYFNCWTQPGNVILQQLIENKWVQIASTELTTGNSACTSNGNFHYYPNYQLNFSKTGTFIYRWFLPASPGLQSFADKPFAIVVNDEIAPEPSQTEVDEAQQQAVELGLSADRAQAAAEKAAADALAAQKAADQLLANQQAAKAAKAAKALSLKRSTITCFKGNITKKVTGVKPTCPPGYTTK